ncbi:type VII secretion protein EssB [Metabacillus rhizolycopersici]|uniref:Type VII secretion protein EssB n=1 Tax=Metabacillus rhizolycopersici TaxID=2875709 RepID=A0ABS7UQ44_9BACI|nr:type VII secretion protein EssB [Metabacillus rhizolycopersici]MBZ5750039.1 type VII secretion protein EssB [Metabacillus rhizolycopersici]
MSSQSDISYLAEKLEAMIKREGKTITFTFQKEKIKLEDPTEISFLKELNPKIKTEIQMMDDELSILHTIPNTYTFLPLMKQIDERDQLMIAYKIIQKAEVHTLTRVHLLVCPENIVLDQGLNPTFLHYGVKESLPPYEKDSDQLIREVKATIAAIVDSQFSFEQYVHYFETLKLSDFTKRICRAENFVELLSIIEERIQQVNEEKSLLMTVNKKTWKMNRYVLLGVTICLIPAFVYSLYSLFFLQPKQTSFIYAQEKFLNKEYSEVVTVLQPYDIKEMPNVTRYALSMSYIINESLAEKQKEVIQNTVTLQSDPLYFEYWILIGRGNADEALDIARYLEDRPLIQYGLIHYKEQVKADDGLDREERQRILAEIEAESNEYLQEMKEQQAEQPVSGQSKEETSSSTVDDANKQKVESKTDISPDVPASTQAKQPALDGETSPN